MEFVRTGYYHIAQACSPSFLVVFDGGLNLVGFAGVPQAHQRARNGIYMCTFRGARRKKCARNPLPCGQREFFFLMRVPTNDEKERAPLLLMPIWRNEKERRKFLLVRFWSKATTTFGLVKLSN
eukprot:scaffold1162_cov170-Amphora_coffeaeformis.AAC.17